MSEAIKIAANMTVSADELRAMARATQNRQHAPHGYVGENATSGSLMEGAVQELQAAGDPDDTLTVDARLDRALDFLKRAKALRSGNKGLGQHGSKVFFVR